MKIQNYDAATGKKTERDATEHDLAELAACQQDNAIIEKLEVENKRRAVYQIESDPLFFGWQRGENTEQEWLDKIAEIRARHPYA